jgi:DNA-binding helix-hairpin-helix protein with protein kinase domain
MKKYFLEDGSKILIDDSKPLGSGGEGSVYKLAKNQNILVKIYTDRALERMPDIEDKIKAMVNQKPGLLDYNGLTIIAWPSYVVYDEFHRFVGYVMRRVQAKNQLSHVITPGLQKAKFPNITYYDRVVIAINLAKVMGFLHQNNTVIGDINTSDFFVYPGFEIGLVDTDSFQVTANNRLFHCKVFTPDYTPPEVIDAKKKSSVEVKRIPNHDNYGLAILIFQILMMGVHPFSARIKSTLGFDGNAINYNMEHEIFPYNTLNGNITPPKNAFPFSLLPKYIQELFNRAFAKHALSDNDRPTTEEWVEKLKLLKESLKKCRKDKTHFYPNHFQKCPICAREQTKDYDYLVDYFKQISRKYVKYETNKKPIIVDENYVYDETIMGKLFTLKKSKDLAYFFDPKLIDKYRLIERIEALSKDSSKKRLSFIPMPKLWIMQDQKIIGYTVSALPHLYRVTTLLKGNRMGKLKITEKAKLIMAKEISHMFKTLERIKSPVELSEIFVDQHFHPYLPDPVLLGTSDQTIVPMAFQKDEYLPQEYYLMTHYQQYQKMLEEEARKKEEEKRRIAEEQRQRDLDLIRSPLEPKVPKVKIKEEKPFELKPTEPVVSFEFEKSHKSIIDDPLLEELAPEIPKNIPYDPNSKQTTRFHLAVIIHTLIQEGHPYRATYKLSQKPISYFVDNNIFIHKKSSTGVEIDEKTKPIEIFPNYYQKTMKKALFIKDPEQIGRPSPGQWQRTLRRMQWGYTKCKVSEYHDYPKQLIRCPYCEMKDKHDHDHLRAFVRAHKRGFTFNYLAFNRLLNYVVLSASLVGLIYLVNVYELNDLSTWINEINLVQKWETVKAFIHFDEILALLRQGVDWLLALYEKIFGGVPS